jgi:hypothetical protein
MIQLTVIQHTLIPPGRPAGVIGGLPWTVQACPDQAIYTTLGSVFHGTTYENPHISGYSRKITSKLWGRVALSIQFADRWPFCSQHIHEYLVRTACTETPLRLKRIVHPGLCTSHNIMHSQLIKLDLLQLLQLMLSTLASISILWPACHSAAQFLHRSRHSEGFQQPPSRH